MFIAELNHPTLICSICPVCVPALRWQAQFCPVELMKRVEEKMFAKVTSVYGLTEASPHDSLPHRRFVGCTLQTASGRDFERHLEVKVIDPETGEELGPIGVQGEMCNKGYNTAEGVQTPKQPPK